MYFKCSHKLILATSSFHTALKSWKCLLNKSLLLRYGGYPGIQYLSAFYIFTECRFPNMVIGFLIGYRTFIMRRPFRSICQIINEFVIIFFKPPLYTNLNPNVRVYNTCILNVNNVFKC